MGNAPMLIAGSFGLKLYVEQFTPSMNPRLIMSSISSSDSIFFVSIILYSELSFSSSD